MSWLPGLDSVPLRPVLSILFSRCPGAPTPDAVLDYEQQRLVSGHPAEGTIVNQAFSVARAISHANRRLFSAQLSPRGGKATRSLIGCDPRCWELHRCNAPRLHARRSIVPQAGPSSLALSDRCPRPSRVVFCSPRSG